MQTPFSNNGYISKNGRQSSLYREHAIHNSVKRGSFFNPSTSNNRMETKLFLIILSWLGVGSYIGGIWLNIGNWKANLMFIIGLLFMIMKFIRYSLKTWQDYRKGELEIKKRKRESN